MANSINSQTSGAGGLVSTAEGTDGILNIKSNDSTIGSFTSSGLTVTGTVTATTLVGNGAAITNLPSATGLVPYTTFVNSTEKVTVSATAATGTINYDTDTQSVIYYTSNAAADWTINFRAASGTTLNSKLATGEAITLVHLVTIGGSEYRNTTVQVDGSSTTPEWQGGSAPTEGNANSIDSYTYTIIKTGDAAFTILAALTQFA
jgi:hypothetical protein